MNWRPPRLLDRYSFPRPEAINTGVVQVATGQNRTNWLSKCDPNEVVWVVVRSQDAIVDWGIPWQELDPEIPPGDNAVGNAEFAVKYTNASPFFSRIRYVRTGYAGSKEVFPILAGYVPKIQGTIVNVSASIGYDPELGIPATSSGAKPYAGLEIWSENPRDIELVRTVDFSGDGSTAAELFGFKPEFTASDDTVLGMPPGFCRYFHVAVDTTGGIQWKIRNKQSGIVVAISSQPIWAGPIAPHLELLVTNLGAAKAGMLTWAVRPLLLWAPDTVAVSGTVEVSSVGGSVTVNGSDGVGSPVEVIGTEGTTGNALAVTNEAGETVDVTVIP